MGRSGAVWEKDEKSREGSSGLRGRDEPGPPSFASFQLKFLSQVQNLGCHAARGLILSALLPAVAHAGDYFLSLSQVIASNVSLD